MSDQPLRVLFFVELNGPSNSWWDELLPCLPTDELDLRLATVRSRGPLHDQLSRLGLTSISLDCRSARDYPVAVARLAKLVRRAQIDVLHSCEPIPGTLGATAGLLAGPTVARVFHRQHITIDGPSAKMSRIGSRLSHMTIACSHAAATAAHEIDGVPVELIRVVYNGARRPREVNQEEIKQLRDRLGIQHDANVVVSVARLRPEKGLTTLIDAAPLVARELNCPLHVIIVGSGPQEAELLERAEKVSEATVRFVGHQADVPLWLALADVVAMPSRREAFGYAAAEAMGSGRPLVASAVGALPELIEDDVSGLLTPPDDPVALAGRVLRLLRDAGARNRVAAAAKRRFEELFTVQAMAPRLVAAWQEAHALRNS